MTINLAKTDEQSEKVVASDDPKASQEPKSESKTTETEDKKTVTESAPEGELGGAIVKEGDVFVFRPKLVRDGKEVTSTTVYKGNTVQEVIDQIQRGIVEKDEHIARLKGDSLRTRVNQRQVERPSFQTTEESDIAKPDIEEIRGTVAKSKLREFGIDTKFLSFSNEDWKRYADEVGDLEAFDMKQQVRDFAKSVAEETNQTYQEQSAQYATARLVDEETNSVAESIKELGVELSADDYEEIVQRVLSSEKSYTREGVYKPGLIQLEVLRHVKTQLNKTQVTEFKKKVEEDVTKTKEKAEGVIVTKKGAGVDKQTTTAPKTVFQAKDTILAEIAAGRLKP